MIKMRWLSKKIAAMTLAMLLGVGMFSTTAFAYSDETAASEEIETIEEPTEEEEKTEEKLTKMYGRLKGTIKSFMTA